MRTSWALFAVVMLGVVLSQGLGQAQPGKKGALDLKATVTSVDPKISPIPLQFQTLSNRQLEQLVSELQDSVASLKKEVAALKAGLNKTNASLDTVKSELSVPKGYTATWMSKSFLDRQTSPEFVRIHVQVPTVSR